MRTTFTLLLLGLALTTWQPARAQTKPDTLHLAAPAAGLARDSSEDLVTLRVRRVHSQRVCATQTIPRRVKNVCWSLHPGSYIVEAESNGRRWYAPLKIESVGGAWW